MKLERKCETCYHNKRDCSYALNDGCLINNLCAWKPYTNLERLQSMDSVEFAELMFRSINGGAQAMICEDLDHGCYYTCKHNYKCHGGDENQFYTSLNDIIDWLNSPVEVDE